MSTPPKPGRIEALDYLRGYFIIVIVIDHVYRWPSLLGFLTGQGHLWSNAADGFLIISGLLIGHIRGAKARGHQFHTVISKLLKRTLMLYGWSILLSIIFYALYWKFSYLAPLPDAETPRDDWVRLIIDLFTLEQAHTWVYYLHLYAIFMAASVITLALLRHNLAWLVIAASLGGMLLGANLEVEWLQKQALFVIPSVAGFYLDEIRDWVVALPRRRQKALQYSAIILFGVSALASILWAFHPQLLGSAFTDAANLIFTRTPISLGTLLVAFVWFIGLFALFQAGLPLIKKYLGWLILPFGTRSLAAYIIHALPILLISYLVPMGANVWLNTLLGILCVLATWVLVRIPLVQKILPR